MFVSPQFLKKSIPENPMKQWGSCSQARAPEQFCLFLLSLRRQKRHQLYNLLCPLKMCGCPLQEHSTSEHLPSLLSNRASLTKRRTIITEDNSEDKWVVHPPDPTQTVCDQIRPPWTAPPQTLVGGGGGGLHKSLHFISLASSELNCVHHYHLNFRRICTAIL